MMLQVNLASLAEALQNAPPFAIPEMDKGTNYLYNQVYIRLARNEEVRLSGLDFSAFEEDDIRCLADLHDDVFERNNYQASRVTDTLRNIDPICKTADYI